MLIRYRHTKRGYTLTFWQQTKAWFISVPGGKPSQIEPWVAAKFLRDGSHRQVLIGAQSKVCA